MGRTVSAIFLNFMKWIFFIPSNPSRAGKGREKKYNLKVLKTGQAFVEGLQLPKSWVTLLPRPITHRSRNSHGRNYRFSSGNMLDQSVFRVMGSGVPHVRSSIISIICTAPKLRRNYSADVKRLLHDEDTHSHTQNLVTYR